MKRTFKYLDIEVDAAPGMAEQAKFQSGHLSKLKTRFKLGDLAVPYQAVTKKFLKNDPLR